MSARWEQKLEQFQRSLEAFRRYAGVDMHYGVVHIRGPQITISDRAKPVIYASGGTLSESLIIPITAEEYQLHLLFSMNLAPISEDLLRQFKSQLRELHDILPTLPQRVLPPSSLPSMANGGDENFIRWGLALIWLGATEQKVFHSEVEYAESASSFRINGRVVSWETLSPVPGFDPIEFVTRTGKPDKGWPYWNDQHTKAGRTFPQVLAVSLTKPIFYASINAVDLLIQSGLDQRPKSNAKRRPSRITSDGTELSDADQAVLSALRKYHQGKEDEGPQFDKLKQKEIAKLAGVSQGSVHRTFKDHFLKFSVCHGRSARKCYELLCEDHIILDIIEYIENPRRREEITNVDFDQFSGDDR